MKELVFLPPSLLCISSDTDYPLFAVYLFIFIVKQFYEYLKSTSIRKNKRRFKRQLAASYKIQKKTIQENYEKGLTDTDKVKKNVYNKTKL